MQFSLWLPTNAGREAWSVPEFQKDTKMCSATIPSFLVSGEGSVPPGDPGEQLVANLTLALFASALRCEEATIDYITGAHALALDLAVHSITYRPRGPSKFARLIFAANDAYGTDNLLVSMIDNTLVLPTITAGERPSACHSPPHVLNIKDVDIAYFKLRLRPNNLAGALKGIAEMPCNEAQTEALRRVLNLCMNQALPKPEPLDLVGDFFIVAHDLTGKRNFPLAALALRNADRALDAYGEIASIEGHHEIIRSMKDQIEVLLEGMRRTAM